MAFKSFESHFCKALHQYTVDAEENNFISIEYYSSLCPCGLFEKSFLQQKQRKNFLPYSKNNIFYSILQFEKEIGNNFLADHNILEDRYYFFIMHSEKYYAEKISLMKKHVDFLNGIKGALYDNIIHNRNILLSAYCLRYYVYLDRAEINIMLNRQNETLSLENGIILNLLEDNDFRVRMNALVSLYFLTSSSSILSITFNHFINMIYDTNIKVQMLASKLFCLLVKKYTIILYKGLFDSTTRQILCRADYISLQLFSALFHLKYDSFHIFRFFNENNFNLKYGEVSHFLHKNRDLAKKLFEPENGQSMAMIIYGREMKCINFNRLFSIALIYKQIFMEDIPSSIDQYLDLQDISHFMEGQTYEILNYNLIEYFSCGNPSIEKLIFNASTEKIKKLIELYQFAKQFKSIDYLYFKFDIARFNIKSSADLIIFLKNFSVEYLNRISYDFIAYDQVYENRILITIESYFTNFYSFENMYFKISYEKKTFYYEISYITYIDIPYIEHKNNLVIYLCSKISENTIFIIKSKNISL